LIFLPFFSGSITPYAFSLLNPSDLGPFHDRRFLDVTDLVCFETHPSLAGDTRLSLSPFFSTSFIGARSSFRMSEYTILFRLFGPFLRRAYPPFLCSRSKVCYVPDRRRTLFSPFCPPAFAFERRLPFSPVLFSPDSALCWPLIRAFKERDGLFSFLRPPS